MDAGAANTQCSTAVGMRRDGDDGHPSSVGVASDIGSGVRFRRTERPVRELDPSGAVHEGLVAGTIERVAIHGLMAQRARALGALQCGRFRLEPTHLRGSRDADEVRVEPGVPAACIAHPLTERSLRHLIRSCHDY